MKVAVLGAGAFGTAMAKVLCDNDHEVKLWGHVPAFLEELKSAGRNEKYLPGIELPIQLGFEADIAVAVDGCEMVVFALPSKAIREVAEKIAGFSGIVVSVTKGIEHESGLTMCGILSDVLPQATAAALSGPSLALEVARGVPSAVVAASEDEAVAQTVQEAFHRPTFRVYRSPDLRGVELGGALKNVVAIAAGACDGLGFGDNSKAAIITRALAEIRRLGEACGAHPDTFAGLSGLGDLTVTCFSKLSRNRGFGEKIGRGESASELLAKARHVVEGFPTAKSAHRLAGKHGVETPIMDEVHAMLHEGKPLKQAIADLIGREAKGED
ncbi:MAG: NAD(P)H-dependent glycerol-3-phosphate dehydrogenase [Limisphaerales bacterium]